MKSHLKNAKYDKPYEAWLIVDKDHWQNQQLEPLHQWSIQREYYHLAVSNPNFEYWLLLHLEDGKGVSTKAECDTKLKRHIPDYSKSNFDMSKLEPGISEAIKRAESKDRPPCEKWPEKTGTTVYLLVKKLHQD